MIDLGFLTQLDVFAQKITLIKNKGGDYPEGTKPFKSDGDETYTIIGSVEPVNDDAVVDFGGQREQEKIIIHTNAEKNITVLGKLILSDKLIVNGNTYQVDRIKDWEGHNLTDITASRIHD